jgi:hypothetical protein
MYNNNEIINFIISQEEVDKILTVDLLNIDTSDYQNSDKYFELWSPLINRFFGNRIAVVMWEQVLGRAQSVNKDIFQKMHKGTPYYFAAMASYLIDDFDKAAAYMELALYEDRKNKTKDEIKDSPAAKFFLLDVDDRNHAAYQIVKEIKNILNNYLKEYKTITLLESRNLTQEIAYKLFNIAISDKSAIATSFISYLLNVNKYRNIALFKTKELSNEPMYTSLFQGCVLFETSLRVYTGKDNSVLLRRLLDDDDRISNLGINKDSLNGLCDEVNNKSVSEIYSTMNEKENSLEKFFAYTYGIRNAVGHNLLWEGDLGEDKYFSIFKNILFANFRLILEL